jgi:diacylglycerol kinase family enzyme
VRRLRSLLERSGTPADVRFLTPERLYPEIVRLVETAVPVVGVAGGDGTLRTAAQALAGTQTALAPLPTGTLNRFARRIGIDSLDDGVARLRSAASFTVPLGIANDQVFLNTATFGAYGKVVRLRNRARRWIRRWPAAALAFTHVIARLRPVELDLALTGDRMQRNTPLLWVRTVWSGEHHLEVVIFHLATPAGAAAFTLRNIGMLLRGEVPDDGRVEILRTRSLAVNAPRTLDVTLDGEAFRWNPPFYVAIEQRALRVAAPELMPLPAT